VRGSSPLSSTLTYGRLMRATPTLHATQSTQNEVYARWARDPEGFWAEAGEAIHWSKRWDRVLDNARAPFYRWFPGATVNTCENALDWHVEHGRADQPALIYDSPVTGTIKTFTYRELRDAVARFAGVLLGQGVGRGDRVIIYMPMVPEAAIAMLACARIGAIHSVVFGGFASHELAARISHAAPVVIVSASCGIEVNRVVPYKPLLDKAIELAEVKPRRCIILQRPQERAPLVAGRDSDWAELMATARPAECVPVAATDPLYILYTSGTTGMPKGVVRDNGGHLVALKWSMTHIYGVEPGEVYWAASDLGWAVGHSYIVYGPLFNGNTTVLYEGKPVSTPDPGAFWPVISGHRVRAFCTAPAATQGSSAKAVVGYDVRVLGEDGQELPSGQTGNIVIRLPLPPGCLPTLWHNDEGYVRSYVSRYPGYYLTADAGYKDADGYLWVMGRTDDIINVAGHRLSTGAMEEVLASHPDVAECAVVGVADKIKGEIPLGLVVLKAGVQRPAAAIADEVVGMVRERIGPVAAFRIAVVVQRLPKTRSGKILRGTVKRIADGTEYRVPPTIDDPTTLDEIAAVLAAVGYPRR